MNRNLIITLINKQLLKANTIIEAPIIVTNIAGVGSVTKVKDLLILDAYVDNDEPKIKTKDRSNNKEYFIDFNNIVSIDGMNVERFALNYDIKPSGEEKKKGGKRTGRPKKINPE